MMNGDIGSRTGGEGYALLGTPRQHLGSSLAPDRSSASTLFQLAQRFAARTQNLAHIATLADRFACEEPVLKRVAVLLGRARSSRSTMHSAARFA